MSSRLGSIYAGMCQELEPEDNQSLPVETWNASHEAEAQRQRYRSDSNISVTSTVATPVQSAGFEVPKWTWPQSEKLPSGHRRISEPLRPHVRV